MNELSKIESEISRLLEIETGLNQDIPYWLQCNYESPVWDIDFNGIRNMSLNFHIRLDDGSLLTEDKNRELLSTFRCWIVRAYERPDNFAKSTRAESVFRRVTVATRLIDYFLVRSQEFKLGEYAMSLVTLNDIKTLMRVIAEFNHVSLSIYRWPQELKNFLDDNSGKTDWRQVLTDHPVLSLLDLTREEFMIDANKEEILQYRVFLWSNDLLSERSDRSITSPSRYSLQCEKVAAQIYANTLRGVYGHTKPPEFNMGYHVKPLQELNPAPVKSKGLQQMNAREISRYGQGLIELNNSDRGLNGVRSVDIKAAVSTIAAVAPSGSRFVTLPHSVVMKALRGAIEYYLQLGRPLLQTYIDLCLYIASHPKSSHENALKAVKHEGLDNRLAEFAITGWTVCRSRSISREKFEFAFVRQGHGLWELLQVLFGAIHITVATLSARRVSELIEQPVDKCLDDSGTFLVFKNRKSGANEMRETELRPIPPIASRMIKEIKWFQSELISLRLIDGYQSFISPPSKTGLRLLTEASIMNNRHLDVFCDYFEMPVNSKGERYYIRTHQLRRFFAMAFFWSGTAAGSDTLGWFLGHTDPAHLYRYVSEDIGGSVLKSVKASLIAELAQETGTLKSELAKLMKNRFGISKFSILTREECIPYVEDLLEEGTMEVEPEFYEDAAGKRHQICFLIKDRETIRT